MGQPYEIRQKQRMLPYVNQKVKRSRKRNEEIKKAKRALKEMYGADSVVRVFDLPGGFVQIVLLSKDKRQQRAGIRI